MKKSILNKNVSVFEGYYNPEPYCTISLRKWLLSDGFQSEVQKIRESKNGNEKSNLKSKLFAITPSGIYEDARKSEYLVEHSGLMCIDIDRKDNHRISDWEELKIELSSIAEIAYCGLSISGDGVFIIIPIKDPENHLEYFYTIERFLSEEYQIKIDNACKDVGRLRVISFDAKPYLNDNATILEESVISIPDPIPDLDRNKDLDGDKQTILSALHEAKMQKINITEAYQDWFEVGCVIANTFGEKGRKIFHDFSKLSSKYNIKECNKQYSSCLNGEYNFGVGTLVYKMKQHHLN